MPCTKKKLAFMNTLVKERIKFTGVDYYRRPDGSIPEYKYKPGWKPIPMPCGKCKWCRIQNSREKGVRCLHQSLENPNNIFLTLTYAPEHLPKSGSYDPLHPVLFVKKLRDKICRDSLCKSEIFHYKTRKRLRSKCRKLCPKIKTFGCAEYGDKLGRPHFHLIIFNYSPPDLKFRKMAGSDWSKVKNPLYTSEIIKSLWTHGFHDIGAVTFASAAYVARYCTKKMNGKKAITHYKGRLPERSICNSHGIGEPWIKKYAAQCLDNDFLLVNGKRMTLPRYYNKKLEKWFPEKYSLVKERRIDNIKPIDLNGTPDRQKVIGKLQDLQFTRLKRGYENAA